MYATKTNSAVSPKIVSLPVGSKYVNDDYSDLEKRYANVETYIKQIANGKIHNLIVNGPPGVGKTHSVESYLNKYAQGKYKVVKGHMTPLSLYGNLYFHREVNSVLVLDDIDSVFKKIEGVNLLKAAIDTSPVRKISWESTTPLKGVGIPSSFEFKGSVILVSNIGFDGHTRGNLSAHLDALKDRSYKIIVADSSKESCFKQVCFMVAKKELLSNFNLTKQQEFSLLEYIDSNLEKFNKVSLRTAVKLAQLISINAGDWRSMADSGLLNGADE
jgi:DNA polymerase III delta prime subunit